MFRGTVFVFSWWSASGSTVLRFSPQVLDPNRRVPLRSTHMSGYAHAYLHRDSIGDSEACRGFIRTTEATIERLYNDGRIDGYQLLYIENTEDAEHEFVLTTLVAPFTDGRFPYVYVRVQPCEGAPTHSLDAQLADLGCARIDQPTTPV